MEADLGVFAPPSGPLRREPAAAGGRASAPRGKAASEALPSQSVLCTARCLTALLLAVFQNEI